MGCNRVESLSHILQRCPIVHQGRIRRHNAVCKLISDYCGKKFSTLCEPNIRHPDGTLFKPDLVVQLDSARRLVADIQISWEGQNGLRSVWDSKRLVYDNRKFLEAASHKWPDQSFVFCPIIVGARGIWPRCNSALDDFIRLPKSLRRKCVCSVLKHGSEIHNSFISYVWRNRALAP